MGRPKASEPRSRQLNFSLTAAELARLKARAQAVGMRTAHFGRTVLLDERRTVKLVESADHHQHRLYLQLARLGNLLNQLVRHLHQTGAPLPADLEPLLRDIRALITQVRR